MHPYRLKVFLLLQIYKCNNYKDILKYLHMVLFIMFEINIIALSRFSMYEINNLSLVYNQ